MRCTVPVPIQSDFTAPGAIYLSQRQDRLGRKRLTACRLRLELGGLPSINEALPKKAKWKHRKRYQRLRNQVERLEGPIKCYRFQKPIDTRVFAYGQPPSAMRADLTFFCLDARLSVAQSQLPSSLPTGVLDNN